ncbi:MAG: acyl-CoA reductase [Akkermansiaceae bacterium]
MTATAQRIKVIAEACKHQHCRRLLGNISDTDLTMWLKAELGNSDALDRYHPYYDGSQLVTRAYAPETILHIVSGNTPHAAFQSLLRGMILGSKNLIKLPSSDLVELREWIDSFPVELNSLIELYTEISAEIWATANAVIAIGSDAAIFSIQKKIQPHQTFIPHGHKISIGIIDGDLAKAARLAAIDASLFNQRGCLSPHAFYLAPEHCDEFAALLADEMKLLNETLPAEPLTLSEAGVVRNVRETTRFMAANSSTSKIWESENNLDWTVIYDASPTLQLSCLNRCIYVRPLPESPRTINSDALGPESAYLSSISLHPFHNERSEQIIAALPAAHRICPLGKSQEPSLFWHHDGFAPLQSLVKWKDIG